MTGDRRCPNGHAAAGDENFCRACGAPFPALVDDNRTITFDPDRTTEVPGPVAPGGPAAKSPTSARRRRGWIAALVGLLVVLLVVGGAFVALRDDDESSAGAPCESGVRWRQQTAPFADGVVIRDPVQNRVAIVEGGARIGVMSPDEARAMGMTSYTAVSSEQYDAIDLAPADGRLFRERAFNDGPGRLYYSAGGAVYEIRRPDSLAAIDLDPARATVIPMKGLDQAPRQPPAGAMLRIKGSPQTWISDGTTRRRVENVCERAYVNVLPDSPSILAELPVAGRS